MNGWHTQTPRLQPGDLVRAEELNDKVDAIDVAFEKLPEPHPSEKGFGEPIQVGSPSNPGHATTREFVEETIEAAVEGLREAVETAVSAVNAALAALPSFSPLSIPNALVQRDEDGDFAANGIAANRIQSAISSLGVATATSLQAVNVVATNLIGLIAQIENVAAVNITAVGLTELGETTATTLTANDAVSAAGAVVNQQVDSLTVRRLLLRDSSVPTPPFVAGEPRAETDAAWLLTNVGGTLLISDVATGTIRGSLSPQGHLTVTDDVTGFGSP